MRARKKSKHRALLAMGARVSVCVCVRALAVAHSLFLTHLLDRAYLPCAPLSLSFAADRALARNIYGSDKVAIK